MVVVGKVPFKPMVAGILQTDRDRDIGVEADVCGDGIR